MKLDVIFVVLIFILFFTGMGYFIFSFQQLQKDQIGFACEFGRLKAIANILGDVEQAEGHQQLCPDQNCTDYFQEVIDTKTDYIKQVDKFYDCDNIVRGLT